MIINGSSWEESAWENSVTSGFFLIENVILILLRNLVVLFFFLNFFFFAVSFFFNCETSDEVYVMKVS